MCEYIVCSCCGLKHEIRNVGIQWANELVQDIEQILLSLDRECERRQNCIQGEKRGANLEFVYKKIDEIDKVYQLATFEMSE